MVALTTTRDTDERASSFSMAHEYGVATAVNIFQGAMVGLNAAGFLQPMVTAVATQNAVGRAEEAADNTAGANGAITCKVRSGIFKWVNDAGNTIVQADIGDDVYAEDDQTVGNVMGALSVAGTMYEIDADGGIWVATAYPIV